MLIFPRIPKVSLVIKLILVGHTASEENGRKGMVVRYCLEDKTLVSFIPYCLSSSGEHCTITSNKAVCNGSWGKHLENQGVM